MGREVLMKINSAKKGTIREKLYSVHQGYQSADTKIPTRAAHVIPHALGNWDVGTINFSATQERTNKKKPFIHLLLIVL